MIGFELSSFFDNFLIVGFFSLFFLIVGLKLGFLMAGFFFSFFLMIRFDQVLLELSW
jgi:hypothetical protein